MLQTTQQFHRSALVLIGAFAVTLSPVPAESPDSNAPPDAMIRRTVKSFDFDERKLGNYEAMPMNWRQIVEPGYPRFLEPRIDDDVGHSSPPSFHLALRGGNIGADYMGRDVPIDWRCPYRLTAWVRCEGLKSGSATLSVCYLGPNFEPLEKAEYHSRPVRQLSDGPAWTRVTIDLPGGVELARWVRLSCRVEQATQKEQKGSAFSPIGPRDPLGQAWFDDISIIRMPRAELRLGDENGIYSGDSPIELRAVVRDVQGADLYAELTVADAEWRIVQRFRVPVQARSSESSSFEAVELRGGKYSATLTVRSGGLELIRAEKSFVRLVRGRSDYTVRQGGERNEHDTVRGCRIGVIMNDDAVENPSAAQQYVDVLRPLFVKIPVWRSGMSARDVVAGTPDFDRMVESLHGGGIRLVGQIASPPSHLAEQYGPGRRGLFDILASDPANWRPYLALVVTRYGSHVQYWQLGTETGDAVPTGPALETAARHIVNEMRPLIGPARLAVPATMSHAAGARARSDDIRLISFPSGRSAADFARELSATKGNSGEVWASVPTLPETRYQRVARLSDYAQAILQAWCHGIDCVFVDIPWRKRTDEWGGEAMEPVEELLPVQALGAHLTGLTPKGPLNLNRGVTAWLFADDSNQHGAVVAWTEAWHENVQRVAFDFEGGVRTIDLWGNSADCPRSADGNEFSVGLMPVIVPIAQPDRAAMLASLRIDPAVLSPAIARQSRTVGLTNTTKTRMRGELRLSMPAGWSCTPSRLRFDLPPGENLSVPVSIRVPSNEAAGCAVIKGHLREDSTPEWSTVLRTWIDVETPDLVVEIAAMREGGHFRIIHRVTNRSAESLNLRTVLIPSGLPRRTQNLAGLAAGETAVREYKIEAAALEANVPTRVSVEQVGGPLRHNALLDLK
ncbi:MAG TPA: NEW3 domain-containing protein [Phycisphaerae bacterium]|nr:NEW3 domain-containing protein [Phycisphaerae bacterium]